MQITVLIRTSASGHYIKPLVVYPGVQPRMQLQEDFHNKSPGGLFGNSSNGWMDGTLFLSWLEFGINEGITKCNVRKPVLLLINRVRCHISIETLEFCATNNIILYVLYPNATHLIQALDLVLMGIIQTAYKEEVWQWQWQTQVKYLTSTYLSKSL